MTYKTILVHLNHDRHGRRALALATVLAQRFEAHLVGLHVVPHLATGGIQLASDGATRMLAALKRYDDDVRQVFETATAGWGAMAEWRSVPADGPDPAANVIAHAMMADLVVAALPDPGWPASGTLDFPDRLALGTGRPVIVVPDQGAPITVPRNITVAWSHRREAARAVADALPLLKAAEKVHLLTIANGDGGHSSAQMEKTLARHGVNVLASRAIAAEYTIGEEIRVRAIDLEADLVVMGCYGHSRLREFALGGVTRHMLRDTTIPILFSH